MTDISVLEQILEDVECRGLFRNPRRVPRGLHDDSIALQGEISIGEREVTLRIILDACFPLCLPRFQVQPHHGLGQLPHVDQRGEVCYADREGLLLDRRRPVDIVADALERVLSVLECGVSGQNTADFADEFENYWSRRPEKVVVQSVLEPTNQLGWVDVLTGKDDEVFIARSVADVSAFRNGTPLGGAHTVHRALYLPLEAGTVIVPPLPPKSFWSSEDAQYALVSGLTSANRSRLERLLNRRPRQREYVVARLPRPSGGHSLFGVRFDGVGKRHPLLGGMAQSVVPLALTRLDKEFLIPRGGGRTDLAEKRVLLVGCGAVGGHLSFELVRSGVLHLTLVDGDFLSPENTFRHALGRRYWNRNKADALKAEIEEDFPYVHVASVSTYIQDALAIKTIKLEDYDLVLIAIGAPTVELDLNERIYALATKTPALFTWLEPFGIGGHALLVHNGDGDGCLECLYSPTTADDNPLHNRAAFAAFNQSFGRDLSGCGSLHTPYSSMDAVRTSLLAGTLAIDALSGREFGNPLLSWRGDAQAFEEAGFRLAPRYGASEDEIYAARYNYCSPRCPICRDKRHYELSTGLKGCYAA